MFTRKFFQRTLPVLVSSLATISNYVFADKPPPYKFHNEKCPSDYVRMFEDYKNIVETIYKSIPKPNDKRPDYKTFNDIVTKNQCFNIVMFINHLVQPGFLTHASAYWIIKWYIELSLYRDSLYSDKYMTNVPSLLENGCNVLLSHIPTPSSASEFYEDINAIADIIPTNTSVGRNYHGKALEKYLSMIPNKFWDEFDEPTKRTILQKIIKLPVCSTWYIDFVKDHI